jgi:hypothetical protein
VNVATITSSLLLLYPRAWRDRYGAEMEEMLTAQRPTLRTALDLVAGAIDARLNPQLVSPPQGGQLSGGTKMLTRFRCAPAGVSVQDQWRSAGWMVGGSLVLTMLSLGLLRLVGPNSFSEGLLYSAFPASLMLSSESSFLKCYSRQARSIMSFAGAALVILVTWAAVAIGNLL